MQWAEVSVEGAAKDHEVMATIFWEEGAPGTVISTDEEGRVLVTGYFPVNEYLGERLERLRVRFRALEGMGLEVSADAVTVNRVDEEDWAESWKEHFKIERVTDRIVVCPTWRRGEYTPRPGDIPLYIDPGMAFGTGTHPTTALCLWALEEHITGGERVLDLGTGSGILAIAAIRLGAARVHAVDLDEMACRVAAENAEINGVRDRVHICHGDLLRGLGAVDRFELVVANIVTEVILEILVELKSILAPGGIFIASGITSDRLGRVERAARAGGFKLLKREFQDQWAAAVLRGNVSAQILR